MAHMLMNKDTMMSVRETPWHGLGAVLSDYPASIDDALQKSGLGWQVRQDSVLVSEGAGDPLAALQIADRIAAAYEFGGTTLIAASDIEEYLAARNASPTLALADGFRANCRADDGAVLGIVSDDYKVVQNEQAFKFLDALIGSELHFETAGSLMNGKRVWVLARLPEWIEIGGDDTAVFVYVANGHDGSMAVTASDSTVRIVCNNTLTWALNKSEHGEHAARVYKFRHTGDLAVKFDEARKVMGMTVNYAKQFKVLGDKLAQQRITVAQFEKQVLAPLIPIDTNVLGKRAIQNRVTKRLEILDLFRGRGADGDTTGNSPGTKWAAVNACAEHADWKRRYTKATDQMARSFEDSDFKQRALDLVLAS